MLTKLIVGGVVSHFDLIEEFKCGNMGGMRRSRATNSLVIISDHTKGLYDDKWYEDILHYTGMGKKGDQDINFMQNRTLAESATNGVNVHLFEVLVPTQYIYRGIVNLTEQPYQETQIGDDGLPRKVWMFPLKVQTDAQNVYETSIEEYLKSKEKSAQKLPLSELRKRAEYNGSNKVSSRFVLSNAFIRDVYVAEYAKRRANGICQLCEKQAPFHDNEGKPYLECHHVEWLSQGGSDTIENTVALCPNCHRRMHVKNLPEDKMKIKDKI
jgi:5-methylcytosine-specific restriction protein A